MIFYPYIIQSEVDASFYTGITSDLRRRLTEHNKSDTKTTRSKKPWKLVYYEEVESRQEARARERYLKSATGREIRNDLINLAGVAQWYLPAGRQGARENLLKRGAGRKFRNETFKLADVAQW